MTQLPHIALRYRNVTIMIIMALIYMGYVSFQALPRRDMPAIAVPVAQVITYYPGASASDVEKLVTKKLELEFTEIPQVKTISSTSKPGISIITIELTYGVPTKPNWDKLRQRVDTIKKDLPKGIVGPNVNDEFSDTASVLLAITGEKMSYRALDLYARKIRDRLKRNKRVGKVEIDGNQEEVVYLYAKKEITSSQLPNMDAVANILKSKNIIYPGAELFPDNTSVKIETSGRVAGKEKLGDIILKREKNTGKTLRVKDLFDIKRTYKRPKYKIRHRGKRALVVAVTMRAENNVIKMGRGLDKALKELREQLPKQLKIEKITNQPMLVKNSIGNFMSNLFQAILIVLGVSIFFMGLRAALIMATAIPLSMLAAFICMRGISWDLQQISIAALIIALGMLVDNAIVITDNIYARLEEGMDRLQAAAYGASELTWPVLMSTLTTVAIFFPLALMPSVSGDFIRSIPIVVGIVLAASFFVAMIVTPLMCFTILPPPKPKEAPKQEESSQVVEYKGLMAVVGKLYQGTLRHALSKPTLVVLLALALFGVAVFGFVVIGKEFFPAAERDQFVINVSLPQGDAVEATDKVVRKVESILAKTKGVEQVTSFLGKGPPRFELGLAPEPANSSYAMLIIKTKSANLTPGLIDKLNQRFRKLPGARVSAQQFKRGPSVGAPVQVRIYGDDLLVLRKLAAEVKRKMTSVPGTYDVSDTGGFKLFGMKAEVDDYRVSLVGMDHMTIAKGLRTMLEGLDAGAFYDGEDKIPILIRGRSFFRNGLGWLTRVSVPIRAERSSAQAPLLQVVSFQPTWQTAVIQRRDNQRFVTVSCQVQGLASRVMNQLQPKIRAINLPAGYKIESAGESEKRNEGFADLANAMLLGILAITILLVIQFNSFRHAFLILGTLPLSLVGAILGLFVTGNAFGFMAFLGVVSLCGVVVNNALILLDYVETRLREGSDYITALEEAGFRRMRPIVLTTLTTVGGLLPLLFSGGAMWTPMAAVLIFGLLSSTFLTLVVIPSLYVIVVGDRDQKRIEAAKAT